MEFPVNSGKPQIRSEVRKPVRFPGENEPEILITNKWAPFRNHLGACTFDSCRILTVVDNSAEGYWPKRQPLSRDVTITRRRARQRGTHLEALELAVPRSVVHHALKIHFHILRPESRRNAASLAASSLRVERTRTSSFLRPRCRRRRRFNPERQMSVRQAALPPLPPSDSGGARETLASRFTRARSTKRPENEERERAADTCTYTGFG